MKSVFFAFCMMAAGADEACSTEQDSASLLQGNAHSQLKRDVGSNLQSVLRNLAADDADSGVALVNKAAMLLRAAQPVGIQFDALPEGTKAKLIEAAAQLQSSVNAAPELAKIFEGQEQELLQSAIELEKDVHESPGLGKLLSSTSLLQNVEASAAGRDKTVESSMEEKDEIALKAKNGGSSRGDCGRCKCVEPLGTGSTNSPDLNVTEYIRATWYIQKQQTNGFQKRNELYCVTATYNETFRGQKLSIAGTKPDLYFAAFNNCNKGGVNSGVECARHGDEDFQPTFGTPLCARIYDSNKPASKLQVAPCPLPKGFTGPYWVVAAGPSTDNYEWAVVTAGQPSVILEDGCTTPDNCAGPAQANCGLWLLTRDQVPSSETMDAAMGAAAAHGISLQRVVDIDHSECNYDGYFIKPNVRG